MKLVRLTFVLLGLSLLGGCSIDDSRVTYLCDGTADVTKLVAGVERETTSSYHRMWIPIKDRKFGSFDCTTFTSSEIQCQSKSLVALETGEPDYWIKIDRKSGYLIEKYETPTERSYFTGKCEVAKGGMQP